MNYIDIRCTNPQCDFYESKIKLSEGTPLFNCPLCGSEMEPAGSAIKADDSTGSKHWLTEIAEDPELWIPDAEEAYPSVIAYEYRKLRRYCREMKPYAVLLSLEDNFEVLLKLEVLLAYAWAAWNTDNAFEVSAASLLTAPGLSPKTWIKLASLVVKELRKAGKQLPGSIPLEQLIRLYTRGDIGNRSAVQIGQGAMNLSRDLKMNEEDDSEAADLKANEEKYSKNIRDNVALLKAVYEAVDLQLRTQELYLKKETDTEKIALTGADKACGLASSGKVYLRTGDIKSEICVYPFIVIGKNRAAVPVAAERLGGEERGCRDIAEASALSAVSGGAGALRRILNQDELVRLADGRDRLKIRRIAEEVNRYHKSGPVFAFSFHIFDLFFEGSRIEIIGVRVDVTENRLRAEHDGGLHGGDKGHIRAEHRVSRFNPIGHKGKLQGFRSVGAADAVSASHVRRKTSFQFFHLAAADEAGALQHLSDSVIDGWLQGAVLGFQINKFHNILP